MSRSKWKGSFFNIALLKNKNTPNQIFTRESSIPSKYINTYISINTGKEFRRIFISKEKVGLKFGTFAYTRKKQAKKKQSHIKKS